jgi:hypothetical protein
METVTTREVPFGGTEVVEPTARSRVSWGSIFAGGVVALAVWAMLYALGLAVGLSVLNPDNPSTLKGAGIFSGIWGLVTPLIALFVGGLVVGRLSGVVRKLDAAIHGLVMWGLATVTGAWLVGVFMATLVSGAASFGRTALQAEVGMHRETAAERASRAPMGKEQGTFEELRREFTGAAPTRRETLEKAEDSAKAFGGMFGALFLGMVSAVAGSTVALTRRRRTGRMVTTTTTPTTEPPLSTHREAYP